MTSSSSLAALALAACAAAGTGLGAWAGTSDDPLAAFRWKSRVLLVLAPSGSGRLPAEQRKLYQDARGGAIERDLVLVEALGNTSNSAALRRRFNLPEFGFRALLVGKDGEEKFTSEQPIGADRLFGLIDSMPMRQQEMRERR